MVQICVFDRFFVHDSPLWTCIGVHIWGTPLGGRGCPVEVSWKITADHASSLIKLSKPHFIMRNTSHFVTLHPFYSEFTVKTAVLAL